VPTPTFALRASAPKPVADKARHYSYEVYADPAMAERFEAMRFSGPIGRLIAETQEEQIAAFLAPVAGRRILDVGTGTGRAAIALAKGGAIVTGVDASAEMLAVAERRARDAGGGPGGGGPAIVFARGDAHRLEFADRSFDAVVCLRVLMHVPDWRASLTELCRVSAGRLVLDYPSVWSAAALQAATRRLAHTMNRSVEAYRVFSPGSVARALAAEGFRVTGEHRQFVLPIGLHKRINSEAWTRRVEATMARTGLIRRFGSPVTIVAERCGS
jgi:2-polyprenyl-3-methyl-5-hydroxy-6-metoxy-1,4-benzoquinol methylase